MKYTFSRSECDLNLWACVTRSLEDTLAVICKGECSYTDLYDFCMKASADAQPLNGNRSMAFWGYGDPSAMPGDACCDFFFLPTYVMVQCLIASALREPSLMQENALRDTLERGLNGCTLNGLCGHGYEAEEVLLDNLKRFLKAGYSDFALKYPSISPMFRKMFFGAMRRVKQDHDEGHHVYGWNNNLKAEQETVLSLAPEWLFDHYGCKPGRRLYVAYGSNMDEEQMATRCPGAELVGIGTIRHAQLDFYLYATVTTTDDPNAAVPVAVWEITEEDERSLDRYEGVRRHFYYKDTVKVLLNNGTEIEGLIYLMENFRRRPCDPGYFDKIANAYNRLGLHDRICDVLEPAWDRSMNR